MAEDRLYGAIELGGTKTVLAIGTAEGRIVARRTVPTRPPEEVIRDVAAFFNDSGPALTALGVGAFGPIMIDRTAPNFGQLCETNKPGWSGFDLAGALERATRLPVRLVTDVGAAAIGEARVGALRGHQIGIYLTVGTGIGGAIVVDGSVPPALLHPEMGHILLQRLPGDAAPSTCRFHDNCAEGLAAGPAIMARFGKSLDHFAPDAPEFEMIADYLGQMCGQLVLTLSPQRIVLGGGVCGAPGVVPAAHRAMVRHMGSYAPAGVAAAGYMTTPALGQDAGITGALLCAAETMREPA
ncbi:MAG: ROK family protein [Porphyrobacter sp.]|nr:ROK family protein [Porphyrobacter sp.]